MLFVFDNFETVQNPGELFSWIDTFIRPPNKVLITSRFRDFKGDYPVEVLGMTEQECELLIDATAQSFKVYSLLTEEYRRELFTESDGHPYVIKILLGEVARAGRLVKIEKIVASNEEILDALFERTFSRLSPAARRVFLTLSSWRSVVPQLAIEAVMLRSENERMDVRAAIEELRQSSFIEPVMSPEDSWFVGVPLAAAIFGRRKLAGSPMKSAVEADKELLVYFGAGQRIDIRHGIGPRIDRMFGSIADWAGKSASELDRHRPMLEFIARNYSPGWLLLASLFEEIDLDEEAKISVSRFLETNPNADEKRNAWNRLANLCRRTEDWAGEIHAWVEMCQVDGNPFETISNTANRLNQIFKHQSRILETEEKRILVQRMVSLMENRIAAEGGAADYARLGWLWLHLKDETKAEECAAKGLKLDNRNEHCLNLARKFDPRR